MRQNRFAREAFERHRAIAQGQTAAQQAGLAFSQLLPQIIESHQGVTKSHPRRGVAHDFLDAPLSLAPLATGATILAVARMPMRARSRPIKRVLYGFAAFRTHARRILDALDMVAPAVDAADCLQRSSIFRTVSHEAKYRRSRTEPGGVSHRPPFPHDFATHGNDSRPTRASDGPKHARVSCDRIIGASCRPRARLSENNPSEAPCTRFFSSATAISAGQPWPNPLCST